LSNLEEKELALQLRAFGKMCERRRSEWVGISMEGRSGRLRGGSHRFGVGE